MSKLFKNTRPTTVESAPNATKPHVAQRILDAIAFMISISALRTFNFSCKVGPPR